MINKKLFVGSQGDSGGPLVKEREDKKYELIGKLVSSGSILT